MGKPQDDNQVSEKEAAQRRDEVIKRMLNTPPTPHEPLNAKKKPPKKKTATKRSRD